MHQSDGYSKKKKKKNSKGKNLAPNISSHASYQKEYPIEPGLHKVALSILPCSLGHI